MIEMWMLIISVLWLVICLVLGLAANGLVCVVMIRSKRLWKNLSSFLIFHLSLADIIFRLVTMPLALVIHYTTSIAKFSFGCKLFTFVTHTNAAAIFASLAAIALERQITIIHPLQRFKTKPKPLVVAAIIWLYAAIASAGDFYSVESATLSNCRGNRNTGGCVTIKRCVFPRNWETKLSVTVNFVLSFVAPLLALITSYTRITYTLWHRAKKGSVHGTVVTSISKSLRMLVIVVLGFMICWGPQFLVGVVYAYGLLDVDTIRFAMIITTLFQFASSIVNPIVYGFYSKDFIKDCRAFCCSCSCVLPLNRCRPAASERFEIGNYGADSNVIRLASVSKINVMSCNTDDNAGTSGFRTPQS